MQLRAFRHTRTRDLRACDVAATHVPTTRAQLPLCTHTYIYVTFFTLQNKTSTLPACNYFSLSVRKLHHGGAKQQQGSLGRHSQEIKNTVSGRLSFWRLTSGPTWLCLPPLLGWQQGNLHHRENFHCQPRKVVSGSKFCHWRQRLLCDSAIAAVSSPLRPSLSPSPREFVPNTGLQHLSRSH